MGNRIRSFYTTSSTILSSTNEYLGYQDISVSLSTVSIFICGYLRIYIKENQYFSSTFLQLVLHTHLLINPLHTHVVVLQSIQCIEHHTQNLKRRSKTPAQRNTLTKPGLGFKLRSDPKGPILSAIPWWLLRYRFPHKLRKLNLALNSTIQLLPLKIVLAAPQVTDLCFVVQHSFLFDNTSNI